MKAPVNNRIVCRTKVVYLLEFYNESLVCGLKLPNYERVL